MGCSDDYGLNTQMRNLIDQPNVEGFCVHYPVYPKMADFKTSTFWKKVAFILTHIAYFGMLLTMVSPGWARVGPGLMKCDKSGLCSKSWYQPVEVSMCLGYVCLLLALVLIQGLTLIEKVAQKKALYPAYIAVTLAAGEISLILAFMIKLIFKILQNIMANREGPLS